MDLIRFQLNLLLQVDLFISMEDLVQIKFILQIYPAMFRLLESMAMIQFSSIHSLKTAQFSSMALEVFSYRFIRAMDLSRFSVICPARIKSTSIRLAVIRISIKSVSVLEMILSRLEKVPRRFQSTLDLAMI